MAATDFARLQPEGHVPRHQKIDAAALQVRTRLIALSRLQKRILLISADFLLLGLALWLSMSFRYVSLYVPDSASLAALLLAAPLLGVGTFLYGGVYRIVTRFIGAHGTSQLLMYLLLSVLIWVLLVLLSGNPGVPRTVVLLYALISAMFIYSSRRMASWLLQGVDFGSPARALHQSAVAIYGAGPAGANLLEALRRAGEHNITGFLETTPSLVGQYIGGIKVYRPEKLETMVSRHGVKRVYLAQAQNSRRERAETLKWLQKFPVKVQILPAIEDLAAGRVTVDALRPVKVDDLLTREPAATMPALVERAIKGKAVMVTGAGGSIGSEIVRTLLRHGPRVLVLLEMSEVALYEIDMEIRNAAKSRPGGAPRSRDRAGAGIDDRCGAGSAHDRASSH